MSDDAKEKAKKLAAARKKLKEFQNRQNAADKVEKPENPIQNDLESANASIQPTTSNASNKVTELQKTEIQIDARSQEVPSVPDNIIEEKQLASVETFDNETPSTSGNVTNVANYFSSSENSPALINYFEQTIDSGQNVNTLQVLVNEKAQLTSQLNMLRNAFREKDTELEDLRTQFEVYIKKTEEIEKNLRDQEKSKDHFMRINAELQHKLAQMNAKSEDKANLLSSLQQQVESMDQQLKEKSHDLEMAQLRIKQLTDESSSSGSDGRVESLTQLQYMHEQQIRDLQAMLQQLTSDKDQANQQYQHYVRHLNEELSSLQTKYSEQSDELVRLQEREQQLVDHISTLEKEIQKNIQVHSSVTSKEATEHSADPSELQDKLEKMNEKMSDFELEKHEFLLKIKSQEDNLIKVRAELQQKQVEIEELQTHLEHIQAQQPDTTKLMASMESDKVAASRAVQQNLELKKQLDELEQKFVQLTNDKADLINELDAEKFSNREMKINYEKMDEKLKTIDEKYKFKDEEMIRLSHENMELQRKIMYLEQQQDEKYNENFLRYSDDSPQTSEENKILYNENHHDHEDHDHNLHNHTHSPSHSHDHYNEDSHSLNQVTPGDSPDHKDHTQIPSDDNEKQKDEENVDEENLEIGKEAEESCTHHHHHNTHDHGHQEMKHSQQLRPLQGHGHRSVPYLPSSEAVEKLQQRFTNLISQVADLTDEKQHLEHLVIQLQSETEIIGEYIALYQHQRRILKQREYEKAAQTQLLQAERHQLREKITLLNNLVSSLGLEIPSQENANLKEHLNAALTESVSIDPPELNKNLDVSSSLNNKDVQTQQIPSQDLNIKLKSNESQQIIAKIQDIITEIKENTKEIPTLEHNNVDHLNCCFGKFEVV